MIELFSIEISILKFVFIAASIAVSAYWLPYLIAKGWYKAKKEEGGERKNIVNIQELNTDECEVTVYTREVKMNEKRESE